MTNLNEAIRAFDATEANLKRLDELWAQIQAVIPSGLVADNGSPDAVKHSELCRAFRHVLTAMPKLGSTALEDHLVSLEEIFQYRLDCAELGELGADVACERHIFAQGEALAEYRFQFGVQRRALVRQSLLDCLQTGDQLLEKLSAVLNANPAAKITGAEWEAFVALIAEMEVLRGSIVEAPARWSDLKRHIFFGVHGDLDDIIRHDWPAVRSSLTQLLYGPTDPVPVGATDLAQLVKDAPTGRVISKLKWAELDDEQFERVVFNLFVRAPRYSNPQWLTATRAPDRGRDLSVVRTVDDSLGNSRVERVIVQCRHWTSRSIGIPDLATLNEQMTTWGSPKVDELIVVTTGRFTTDAVTWVETHNAEKKSPLISMWPDSHLEMLLASRPDFVAQFGLR